MQPGQEVAQALPTIVLLSSCHVHSTLWMTPPPPPVLTFLLMQCTVRRYQKFTIGFNSLTTVGYLLGVY